MVTAPTPEDTLAWEAAQRRTAGLAGAGAALLTLAGSLISGLSRSAVPDYGDRTQTVLDTLGRATSGEPPVPGRLAAQTQYLGEHAALPILGAILFFLGSLLMFPLMGYLFRAVRARRPEFGQIALILLAFGVVAFSVGRLAVDLGQTIGAMGFDGGTNKQAADAVNTSLVSVGLVLYTAGTLGLGFAFVLISLNAMRVGLLTRFMGILGVIVGATFVLPLDQQGIIRVFWLGALAALILGRWPSGVPAAWSAGEAVPWPTQQELRERREAARADDDDDEERAARIPPPARPPEGRVGTLSGEPHPSSKKRKRKRRA
jgi:hypothetical protein